MLCIAHDDGVNTVRLDFTCDEAWHITITYSVCTVRCRWLQWNNDTTCTHTRSQGSCPECSYTRCSLSYRVRPCNGLSL